MVVRLFSEIDSDEVIAMCYLEILWMKILLGYGYTIQTPLLLPLPQSSFLYTDSKIYNIQNAEFLNGEVSISDIRKEISKIDIDGNRLDSKLSEMGQASLDERFPILLLGELANPWTLSNLKLGAIPIFSAVLENLCRVWSDGLDSRYSNPGCIMSP